MEITEKMLEEKLTQIIGENLKNSLPEIAKAELGAVVEKMKAEKTFPGFAKADSDDQLSRKAKIADFVKKVFHRDASLKALAESVDSTGGYLVPQEVAMEVDRIIEDYGLIRKLARVVPMNRDVMNMPVLGSAATVTWPGEAVAGSDGSPTFGNVKLTAKTAVGLAPFSNELLADANPAIVDLLLVLFSESLAGEEDKQGLVGTGSPFTGVIADSNVTPVVMASGKTGFADVSLDNLRDMISNIKQTALPGSVYIMHRTVWGLIQKITENSQHIVSFQNPIASGTVQGGLLTPAGYLWGYPVYLSDKMPSTTDSAVSTKFIIFGNFNFFYLGKRQEMGMDISREATVGGVNAFAANQSIVRVIERIALAVGVAGAFTTLKTAAS